MTCAEHQKLVLVAGLRLSSVCFRQMEMGKVETTLSQIEVLPARLDQAPILANLLELYSYDFSEILDLKVGEDGRFGYQPLPLYWSEPNRFPFLVKVDGDLAGFALVCRGSEISGDDETWDLTEFFIMRGYRRSGAGTTVAHQIWRKFSGLWEVRVTEKNRGAHAFWKRAVSNFTYSAAESIPVEVVDRKWNVFSFVSQAATQ
jgi:predicted acetyltransferase